MPLSDNIQPDSNRATLTTKETLERIQQRMNNPIVQALTGEVKRPTGARLVSNYPYYRERFALEFKGILDEMIVEYEQGILEDRIYRYDDFPQVRPITLYLRVNQSRAYLLDRLDTDKKYAAFCELIAITRSRQDKGIRVGYNRDLINPANSAFKPSIVEIKARSNEWKEKLDSFLENGKEGEELTINKLALGDEDITNIQASLEQLTNVTYRVDAKSIWVAKF